VVVTASKYDWLAMGSSSSPYASGSRMMFFTLQHQPSTLQAPSNGPSLRGQSSEAMSRAPSGIRPCSR
jgi:hypothetical protein